MGWIHIWSRLASLAPGVANVVMQLAKPFTGIAPERRMPRYAPETFVERFRRRVPTHSESNEPYRRVMLWPDTFNNYFHPETLEAAVDVLEAAGYHVTIPRKQLCCGRPLYDWGFLGMAKRQLEEILDAVRPELQEGVAVIGLEPSCVSVFRDELPNLFPHNPLAKRLTAAAMTLSEFIEHEGAQFRLPQLNRKALVQAHCHQNAVMKFDAEESVMKKIGLQFEHPDSGCCGMAGAFGFEEKNYEISMRIGDRVLLPKVRGAAPGYADHRRRFQLPRADRASHRPRGPAPVSGAADGPARGSRRAGRQLPGEERQPAEAARPEPRQGPGHRRRLRSVRRSGGSVEVVAQTKAPPNETAFVKPRRQLDRRPQTADRRPRSTCGLWSGVCGPIQRLSARGVGD